MLFGLVIAIVGACMLREWKLNPGLLMATFNLWASDSHIQQMRRCVEVLFGLVMAIVGACMLIY